MAEQGSPGEDRTEAATQRRMQRAREEGNVPVSRELPMLASLGAATLILAYVAPGAARDLTVMLRAFLAHADAESLAGAGAFRIATSALVRSVAPLALAAVAAGAGAVLIQTGFLFNAAALRPQAGRISPRAGIRRLL
ncbi:MAG TPA: EscU/YscU/HrcU family type III secretion system export apparatus switch protein, partial [Acetobacteraceae bacterium]